MSDTPARQIHMARPDIGPREKALVEQVLDSGTLAMGSMTLRFEEALAATAGRRFAIACSSGTAGLHMIMRALGIGPGDEVITTPFSFIASVNCILYEGARPCFVDIEEDTLGIDPGQIASAASPRTAGVLPVHVFGRPARIEDVTALAEEHNWHLIEDACEALGASRRGRLMGSFGTASVFAFYPNKQITTGEGGAVVTDDPELVEALRSLRNQGRDTDGTWLRHVRLGYNYRLDEMSAAVGVAQLERLADLQAARARVATAYAEALAGDDLIQVPAAAPDETVDWFVYVVRLHPDIDRERVMADLADAGIPSRPYFQPLHLQPFIQESLGYATGDFPVTERVAASTLALPWSTRLPIEDVAFIAEHLRDAVRRQADG